MRGYMAKPCKDLKTDYQWQLKSQYHDEPITAPLAVSMELYLGTKRRADIDNFNKLVFDSLSGIVYEDDSQIQHLTIAKLYDKTNPRIELSISELPTDKAHGA